MGTLQFITVSIFAKNYIDEELEFWLYVISLDRIKKIHSLKKILICRLVKPLSREKL